MSGDTPDDPPDQFSSDWEKRQWQAEQLARDADHEKRREKDAKARLRRARSAQRQLKKAQQQLEDMGEITDWEQEFITSVDERLDKFGAAFADRTKGGAADALSMRQKQVLAQMRRKIKDKGKQAPDGKPQKKQWGSSFKNDYAPRVRNIEDDMHDDPPAPSEPAPVKRKPFLTVIKGGKD